MPNDITSLPIAIIGGGPVGLAAAAHLTNRNLRFILFEAADSLASNILSWQHVKVFSPWKYNIDKAAKRFASASYNRKDKLNAIFTNATWRDIGAATGTLAGGLLLRVRRSFGGIFNSYLYTCSLPYHKFEKPNRH